MGERSGSEHTIAMRITAPRGRDVADPEASGPATGDEVEDEPSGANLLLDIGADRLDIGLKDVAAPIASIALEADELRWLEDLARDGCALSPAGDLQQRRQVVERQIGLERVEPMEQLRNVDIGLG